MSAEGGDGPEIFGIGEGGAGGGGFEDGGGFEELNLLVLREEQLRGFFPVLSRGERISSVVCTPFRSEKAYGRVLPSCEREGQRGVQLGEPEERELRTMF